MLQVIAEPIPWKLLTLIQLYNIHVDELNEFPKLAQIV